MLPIRRRPAVLFLFGFALVACIATPSRSSGQSLWLPRDTKSAVMLEMLRPNVEYANMGVLSAAYFLSGRVSLGPHAAVVAELPYVHTEGQPQIYDYGYYGEPYYYYYFGEIDGSSIGNPYLGIETKSDTSPIFIEAGVRGPLARDDRYFPLSAAKQTDATRWNAFVPDLTSIQAAFNVREVTPHHLAFRLRLSPVVTFYTRSGSTGEVSAYAHYLFEIGYQGARVRIGTGVSGRVRFTDVYGNLGGTSANQLDVRGDFLSGAIRPGLAVRLPLGSVATSVPVVFGVTLAWVR